MPCAYVLPRFVRTECLRHLSGLSGHLNPRSRGGCGRARGVNAGSPLRYSAITLVCCMCRTAPNLCVMLGGPSINPSGHDCLIRQALGLNNRREWYPVIAPLKRQVERLGGHAYAYVCERSKSMNCGVRKRLPICAHMYLRAYAYACVCMFAFT